MQKARTSVARLALRRSRIVCAIAWLPLLSGGCPRPEDALEPNNLLEDATPMSIGVPVEGRVVQGNPDVFSVSAGPDQTLVFTMASVGEEEQECVAFAVAAPDGTVLYRDRNATCGRSGTAPDQVEGAALQEVRGFGFELRVPASTRGQYALTLTELGQADNIFTFSWRYRITATVE